MVLNFVISVTSFEPKNIWTLIRIGIEREQWRVAIHFPGKGLPEERTVFGTREDAEIAARSMIDAWLRRKRPELKKIVQ